MSASPYAPPASRVGDLAEPRRAKPRSVRIAVACLWATLAFSVAMAALELPETLELMRTGALAPATLGLQVLFPLASFALFALIAVKVNAGRNWARWLYVALYALGMAMMAFALLMFARMNSFPVWEPLESVSLLVQTALQTAALMGLFTRDAREWFR